MHQRKNFFVKGRNTGFSCANCGAVVAPHPNSVRNHCHMCLWSLHVDETVPGDRAAACQAPMEPIACLNTRDGFKLTHRCTVCQKMSINIGAPDDNRERYVAVAQKAADLLA
ncbi:MAG: RNHCP domain-containing protein [Parcubacteria group bacterium]